MNHVALKIIQTDMINTNLYNWNFYLLHGL